MLGHEANLGEIKHSKARALLGAAALILGVVSSALTAAFFLAEAFFVQSATFTGPFAEDGTDGSQLRSITVPDFSLRCCAAIVDDSTGGNKSGLRLWINSVEIRSPHTDHEAIRRGSSGFSHWGTQVLFGLPAGIANDAQVQTRIDYPLRLARSLLIAPAVTGALGVLLGTISFWRSGNTKRLRVFRIASVAALVIGAMTTTSLIAADLGLVRHTETFQGPFAGSPEFPRFVGVTLNNQSVFRCCLSTVSDNDSNGASTLRLWIDDREVTPGHQLHEDIRQKGIGFSHWGDAVYFTLPDGAPNTEQTRVRVEYPLKASGWVTMFFLLATAALFYVLYNRRVAVWLKTPAKSVRIVAASPYYLLFAIAWLAFGLSCLYLGLVGWALANGSALPLAAPFSTAPIKGVIRAMESVGPLVLLLLAMVAGLFSWLFWKSPAGRASQRGCEVQAIRWMSIFGLPTVLTLFLASIGASWAGILNTSPVSSFGGLVPYYDAGGYFSDVHTFLHDGAWSEFSSRRPLAAALRTTSFVLTDLRFTLVVVVQTLATGLSVHFASASIMRWRGVWAGLAFLALAYIVARPHLSTTMTEPLALPIAFCAIPFLIEGIRLRAKWPALLGVLLVCVAMWLRPGPVLVIPAIMLWFGIAFGGTLLSKMKLFLIAGGAFVAILGFEFLIGKLYGSGSPGNFGHIFCGISIGGGWSACLEAFPAEFAQHQSSAQELQAWLYAKGLQNLLSNPAPFLNLAVSEPFRFLAEAPKNMLGGYNYAADAVPAAFPMLPWLAATGLMFLWSAAKRASFKEWSLWLLIVAALVGSATVFYFSDGPRAYLIGYVLIAVLASWAYSSPAAVPNFTLLQRRQIPGTGLAVAGTVAAIMIIAPFAGRHIYSAPTIELPQGTNERMAIVGDMAHSSGFLVVADGQPLPNTVPAMHFSKFADIVQRSGVEVSQGIISPERPNLPFGFVIAPRRDTVGSTTWITPPEMLTRRDVSTWRVTYSGWNPTGALYSQNWWMVTHAEPYSAK